MSTTTSNLAPFSMLDLLLRRHDGSGARRDAPAGPITDALLGNNGIYAPFLSLALACEGREGRIAGRTGGHARPHGEQLNRAQLAALSFADTMESPDGGCAAAAKQKAPAGAVCLTNSARAGFHSPR